MLSWLVHDYDFRATCCPGARLHDDLDVIPEQDEEPNEPVEREAREPVRVPRRTPMGQPPLTPAMSIVYKQ